MAENTNAQAKPSQSSTYEKLGPYYCKLSFARYSRQKPFDNATFNSQRVIILPLPLELMDTTSVDYTTNSLEVVGDILNMNVGSFAAGIGLRMSGDQISQAGGAAMGALAQRLGGSADMASGLSQEIQQQVLQPDKITSALQAQLGLAPNPNLVVNFQGPKLREFSFSWTFYPETPTESRNIKRAIEEIRKRSLPFSVQSGSTGVLGYPDMVLMNFYPWDNGTAVNGNNYGWTENSIIRMKRCVIDRVAVNYAPNNVPAFFEGTTLPVAVRLEISLREIEYMLAEDYMIGQYKDGEFIGDEANAFRNPSEASMTIAGVAGGAIIGGSVGGTPGAVVGGVVGGVVTATQNIDSAPAAGAPASPGGTAQPAQPQATPNPVQEAVAQPNGGR
jgi:hypothetical protein